MSRSALGIAPIVWSSSGCTRHRFDIMSAYVDSCSCFFQAEDGIRDLVRSRGLGDVYKRQVHDRGSLMRNLILLPLAALVLGQTASAQSRQSSCCLLYTSDAADERSSVDLGGRRIIKKRT